MSPAFDDCFGRQRHVLDRPCTPPKALPTSSSTPSSTSVLLRAKSYGAGSPRKGEAWRCTTEHLRK